MSTGAVQPIGTTTAGSGSGKMAPPDKKHEFDKNFRDVLTDVAMRCKKARDSQFQTAREWEFLQRYIGLAAVIAGVLGGGSAGTAAIADNPLAIQIAAVASTTAGLLAAADSFLKGSERGAAHKRAGDKWSKLRDEVIALRDLKSLCQEDHEELTKKYGKILDDKEKIAEISPVVSWRVYKKVQKEVDGEKAQDEKEEDKDMELRVRARAIAVYRAVFFVHLSVFAAVNVLLLLIWWFTSDGEEYSRWFLVVLVAWGFGVIVHWLEAFRGFLSGYIESQADKEFRRLKGQPQ